MFRIEATPINPPGAIGYDPRRRSMQFASADRAKRIFDKWTADGWNVYRYGPIHGAPPCRGSFDNKTCIWFDSIADIELYGWRFAGHTDEILTGRAYDHRGWFTAPDGWDGETMRGAVVLLPHGLACPAVVESVSGMVVVFADSRHWVEATSADANATRAHHQEAARCADRIAEIAAEKERDYQEKWRRAANLADRIDELTKLGQFADGSRLSPWIESERETLLTLEALSKEFMKPFVDSCKLPIANSAGYYPGEQIDLSELRSNWPKGENRKPLPVVYFSRLSASGYLDCTDWQGPFATIAEAFTELANLYGEGITTHELADLDLIDDPECTEHFPHPRAGELLTAKPYRRRFHGVGRHFIGFDHTVYGLEIVRGDDGASIYFQGDDIETVTREIAARGVDSVGADYAEQMTL